MNDLIEDWYEALYTFDENLKKLPQSSIKTQKDKSDNFNVNQKLDNLLQQRKSSISNLKSLHENLKNFIDA